MKYNVTISADSIEEFVLKTLHVSALANTWQLEVWQLAELSNDGVEVEVTEPEPEPEPEEEPETEE